METGVTLSSDARYHLYYRKELHSLLYLLSLLTQTRRDGLPILQWIPLRNHSQNLQPSGSKATFHPFPWNDLTAGGSFSLSGSGMYSSFSSPFHTSHHNHIILVCQVNKLWKNKNKPVSADLSLTLQGMLPLWSSPRSVTIQQYPFGYGMFVRLLNIFWKSTYWLHRPAGLLRVPSI